MSRRKRHDPARQLRRYLVAVAGFHDICRCHYDRAAIREARAAGVRIPLSMRELAYDLSAAAKIPLRPIGRTRKA